MVIMYADKVTESMQKTIEETKRRRKKQKKYNKAKGISPQPLIKENKQSINKTLNPYKKIQPNDKLLYDKIPLDQLVKMSKQTKIQMKNMAKQLNFIEAAKLRDELKVLEKIIKKRT